MKQNNKLFFNSIVDKAVAETVELKIDHVFPKSDVARMATEVIEGYYGKDWENHEDIKSAVENKDDKYNDLIKLVAYDSVDVLYEYLD
jgi:hypothetical protein